MHQVLLSLGANLGSPLETLTIATKLIKQHVLQDVRVSSFYETEPVGFTDQPAFINIAVVGTSTASQVEIHAACKGIEHQLGRVHREQWHEREIDIDVILVGSVVYDDGSLHIPHLRMHERMFVLVPACELIPDAICPRSNKPLAQLLAECNDNVSKPQPILIRE